MHVYTYMYIYIHMRIHEHIYMYILCNIYNKQMQMHRYACVYIVVHVYTNRIFDQCNVLQRMERGKAEGLDHAAGFT